MINPSIWQSPLESQNLRLVPLQESDFDALFKAASDPLIWEQHPDSERYKFENFKRYFDSGLNSRGAYLILERSSNELIGSTRFTNHSEKNSSLEIGYTFLTKKHWGGPYNRELKSLMLSHAFQYVDKAYFVVGRNNQRSRKAMQKIGGVLVDDTRGIPLDGDPSRAVIYIIDKSNFDQQKVMA